LRPASAPASARNGRLPRRASLHSDFDRQLSVGNRRVQGASRILGAVAADVAKHAVCDVLIANTTLRPATPAR